MEKKIDLMIIGAQKAGTTSLLRYIGEHPQCVSHPQKEFAYFLDSIEYENNYKKAFSKYYSEQAIFPGSLIIAKSASLYTSEDAIKRLYDHNKKCELVFMLRNPVERTYSSYLMEKNAGSINYGFEKISSIINNPDCWEYFVFIEFSFYAKHLKNIYKYFPKEQVNIVFYEDFKKDELTVCQNIFKKLSIDDKFVPNLRIKHNVTLKSRSSAYAKTVLRMLRKNSRIRRLVSSFVPSHKAYKYGNALRSINKTKEKHSPINEEARKTLIDFFSKSNEELSKLTGRDLSNWSE